MSRAAGAPREGAVCASAVQAEQAVAPGASGRPQFGHGGGGASGTGGVAKSSLGRGWWRPARVGFSAGRAGRPVRVAFGAVRAGRAVRRELRASREARKGRPAGTGAMVRGWTTHTVVKPQT